MRRKVFKIVREEFEVSIEDRLSLEEDVSSQDVAEREVERLNRRDAGKPWRYSWQEWTIETPDE